MSQPAVGQVEFTTHTLKRAIALKAQRLFSEFTRFRGLKVRSRTGERTKTWRHKLNRKNSPPKHFASRAGCNAFARQFALVFIPDLIAKISAYLRKKLI